MDKYVLAIGTSMTDIIAFSDCTNNICNPGKVQISHGGVSRNIVENLLRLGVKTNFITVFGNDGLSLGMKQELLNLGCDLCDSITTKNQGCSFLGIYENEKLIKAVADSNIMKELTIDYLITKSELINNAEYIIFDVNDYELYDQFITIFKDKKIIVDPVSPVKANKIKHLLPYFHTLKPNLKEAETLCGFAIYTIDDIKKAGNYFLKTGVKNVFITMGDKGIYYKNNCEEGLIKVPDVVLINEVGAGDAFVAGICQGHLNKRTLIDTATFAYSCALETLETNDTVNKSISLETILNREKNTLFSHILL